LNTFLKHCSEIETKAREALERQRFQPDAPYYYSIDTFEGFFLGELFD
jgi:hypothetical protein